AYPTGTTRAATSDAKIRTLYRFRMTRFLDPDLESDSLQRRQAHRCAALCASSSDVPGVAEIAKDPKGAGQPRISTDFVPPSRPFRCASARLASTRRVQ